MRTIGNGLAVRLTGMVHRLDLDNRELPIDRGQDEEEDLVRMLIAAAWYQVLVVRRSASPSPGCWSSRTATWWPTSPAQLHKVGGGTKILSQCAATTRT